MNYPPIAARRRQSHHRSHSRKDPNGRLGSPSAILGFLIAASVLWGPTANAASFTGPVGVGTWNTQAEFADVRVAKGAMTLYESDFAGGMDGWTTSGGTWKTQDGSLRQTGTGTPALAWVGSATWTDYSLTVRARKLSGSEGFLITFGAPGGAKSWWNIGGWGNVQHALEVPGVSAIGAAGAIATGRWYDIRIELRGSDIRCYLDGALIHDTARVLDATERGVRFQQLRSSSGYNLLNAEERQRLIELSGRTVYPGAAARATFDAMPSGSTFAGLSAAEQAVIIRKVNRHRLTWNTGWGFGSDPGRDQEIIASMDVAVIQYNSLGLFEKHITANNSPGTPTADANYDGQIRFGGSRNARVAIHEMSHCMGAGTYWRWPQLMVNGRWTGQYTNLQLSSFGAGSALSGDAIHFWPYGLNYDNEDGAEERRRNVLLVAAIRRDMGVHTFQQTVYTTEVADGLYRLTPRHAQGKALDVLNADPENGASIDIATRIFSGADRQGFLLDRQSDGTYRIRTALAGNRCLELPGGVTDRGTRLRLWDDTGGAGQRWYLIPMDDGWYKIAPKSNLTQCWDVEGISTEDGALVAMWDYWDGFGQQWLLTLLRPAFTMADLTRALAISAGTQRATGSDTSRLDVVGGTGASRVEMDDAIAIARKVAGLDVNP